MAGGDWTYRRAVAVNRGRLIGLLAGFAVLLGSGPLVARQTHKMVTGLLRPAESALRRLVAVLAAEIVVETVERQAGGRKRSRKGKPRDPMSRAPAFPMLDRRTNPDPPPKRPTKGDPAIRGLDEPPPPPRPEPEPETETVCAALLRRRIEAMQAVLGDLSGTAARMARAVARHPQYLRSIRPGRPPGYRDVPEGSIHRREVDDILEDCHGLALLALHEAEARARGSPTGWWSEGPG